MNLPKKPMVWVTGAGGLIGNYLVQTAPAFAPDWQILPIHRRDLDLTDAHRVRETFRMTKPILVIHCAALSKTPACQANPALARQINVETTRLLAELCAEVHFVFFSTDLVFDGKKGNYAETDSPRPLNVYAETKVAAEAVVLENPAHTVVRTSLNGGVSPTGDRGFNEEMRRAWSKGLCLSLFTDEFRCPISAEATARAVWELSRARAAGVFHLAGSERLSRWQIGKLLAARCPELRPRLEPSSLSQYQGPPRSPDTSLDCRKLQAQLSFPLPGLTDWLAAHPQAKF